MIQKVKTMPCETAERKTDGSLNRAAKRSYLEAMLTMLQAKLDQIKKRS